MVNASSTNLAGLTWGPAASFWVSRFNDLVMSLVFGFGKSNF